MVYTSRMETATIELLETDEGTSVLALLDDRQRLVLGAMFPLIGRGMSVDAAAVEYGVTKESALRLKQSAAGVEFAKRVCIQREKRELEQHAADLARVDTAIGVVENLVVCAEEQKVQLAAAKTVLETDPSRRYTKTTHVEGVMRHQHTLVQPEVYEARLNAAHARLGKRPEIDVTPEAAPVLELRKRRFGPEQAAEKLAAVERRRAEERAEFERDVVNNHRGPLEAAAGML
jgi:hypothetical protein